MTGVDRGSGCKPGQRARCCAALAAAFMAVTLQPAATWASAARQRPARGSEAAQIGDFETDPEKEAVRAQNRWLPLHEALRLVRREPREAVLFAHPREGATADELGRRLAAQGYRVEVVTAADGPAPVLELLQAVQSQKALPSLAVILPGSIDPGGTPASRYSLALHEIIAALSARGANLHRVVVSVRDTGGEAPGYRARMLQAARRSGTPVADLAGALSPQVAADALARTVLAAEAPHPSLVMLVLYPICSMALFWLWRRSRF